MSRHKDRQSALGLLPRMEARPWAGGKTVTYRYHKHGEKKPINLGTDKAAALQRVLDMNGQTDGIGTLRWVMTQFRLSTRWKKYSEGTRDDYELAWKQIDSRLGAMQTASITSTIVARYVHIERVSAPRRADIEKSLLSRLFGHGIKLGVCSVNATIGVEPHGSEARDVKPLEDVLVGFLAWLEKQTPQRRIIGMAAEYASLAGSRKVEFLDLSWPQVDRAARQVRTFRAKQRGKRRGEVVDVVEITPKLDALLDRLEALRAERGVECLYVFPTRGNNAYSARGFKTLWQRCVLAAIEEDKLSMEARFTFHDLRAYYASMHKTETGTLPDLHKNPETTARVYDRNREVKRRAL